MTLSDRFRIARALPLLSLLVWLSACEEDPALPAPDPPTVSAVAAGDNPFNTLSAVVTFSHSGAEAARVVCVESGGEEESTPWYGVTGDTARIVVLGLLDTTTYTCRVDVTGAGGSVSSETVDYRTGALPDTLGFVDLITSGTSSGGYTLTAIGATGYMAAIDGNGRIRWYRQIDRLFSRHVLQLENGHFAAFTGWTTGPGLDYGEYVELLPDGEIVGAHRAPQPLYTDGHDIVATVSAGEVTRVHLFSYYHRVLDMSAWGGPVDAVVAGHQILRLRQDGSAEFAWDAWDHFTVDDWIEEPASQKANALVDFDHPNSLDIDADGNYVVSWRHLAEVTCIDSRTGAIRWRLGGRNNQFTFIGDTFGEFNGQHSAVTLANGNILLYDNGLRHSPPESRAVEYALDTTALTATQVWEYRHSPPIYTPFVGSVQRLANGNTVVGFGGEATVTEVTPAGDAVWEGQLRIDGAPLLFYRGRRIASLYAYTRP